MGGGTWVLWLHPIMGGLATVLVLRAAGLGLTMRRGGAAAVTARQRHRRITPWTYGAVVGSGLGGVASTWLWRPDLTAGASGHFQVGCVVVACFTIAALVARRIGRDPWARTVHPWIAAAGVLAVGVQVFLGLQIVGQ